MEVFIMVGLNQALEHVKYHCKLDGIEIVDPTYNLLFSVEEIGESAYDYSYAHSEYTKLKVYSDSDEECEEECWELIFEANLYYEEDTFEVLYEDGEHYSTIEEIKSELNLDEL